MHSPGTPDVVTQQLLSEHCDGEQEEEAPCERVQLAHQPVLPPDLRLVHCGGGQTPRDDVNNLVHALDIFLLFCLFCHYEL